MVHTPPSLDDLRLFRMRKREERWRRRIDEMNREVEARRRQREEKSARQQRENKQEEVARQEATGRLRHWIERICREDAQERRAEEEAAARRREEERRVLERESGFPHTPPPRVIRVGASAPVSAISESGLRGEREDIAIEMACPAARARPHALARCPLSWKTGAAWAAAVGGGVLIYVNSCLWFWHQPFDTTR